MRHTSLWPPVCLTLSFPVCLSYTLLLSFLSLSLLEMWVPLQLPHFHPPAIFILFYLDPSPGILILLHTLFYFQRAYSPICPSSLCTPVISKKSSPPTFQCPSGGRPEKERGRNEREREKKLDWGGRKDRHLIGSEKLPGVRNSPAKAPSFPRFSHLYSWSFLLLFSPLLLHHASSPLSLFLLSASLTTSLPPSLSLSFRVSCHPALLHLHRGAAPTIRTLHAYTYTTGTQAPTLTDSYTHTTQGDTHPPLPAAPTLSHIFPLQTRNTLQPLVCQRFIKRHCQHYITTVFCIYTSFDTTYESL